MSIVRMRKVFRRRNKIKLGKKEITMPSVVEVVFYMIVVIFLVGAYYTFGGPASPGSGGGEQGVGRVTPVVAKVNGHKISYELYMANLNMQLRSGMNEPDVTNERYVKTSTLSGIINALLLSQASGREKIKVSSEDLEAAREEQIQMMLDRKFPEKKQLRAFLKKNQMELEEYKDKLRREEFRDLNALREQVTQKKLKEMVESRATVSDEELKDSYKEVRASHILIKPEDAKAKLEQAAGEAKTEVTEEQADAAARKQAEELLAKVKAGEDFAKLAKAHSGCPSAEKGGDLDWFKRGSMVKEFEEAAFKLQPGGVSEIVKTAFGYHIIKVTGSKSEVPKDFEEKKEEYRAQLLMERKNRVWSEYQAQLEKEAAIEVLDPELLAYRLLDAGQQAEGQQALEQALKLNPNNVVAAWELASLHEQQAKMSEAVELLERITGVEEGARSPNVRVKLAELYEKQGNKEKALAEYKDAFDRASAFTFQNMMVNMRLEGKFKELGQKELADQVTKWLEEFRASQGSNPFGNFMVQ